MPIIVVHDSNTNYIPIDNLFELRAFYDKNFTGYCADPNRVDSPFLFDLFLGANYEDAAEIKQISPDIIEMTSSAHVINQVLNKIDTESHLIIETSIPRDQIIPKYVTDRMQLFINKAGFFIIEDDSEYSIQIKKIGIRE